MSRSTTAREALVAELIGDLTELLDRAEILTSAIDEAREALTEPVPVQRTPRSTMSVIHGRPVRSLATNREPAVGG